MQFQATFIRIMISSMNVLLFTVKKCLQMDDLILHCGWNIGSQLSFALKELCISDRYIYIF